MPWPEWVNTAGRALNRRHISHFYKKCLYLHGISSGPISKKDGMSKRIRVQLRFANLIDNWARFFTRILIHDIPGRKEAKRLESEHIQAYKEKHGQRPRGNLKD